MKRIFRGISYIMLLTLMLTYFLIGTDKGNAFILSVYTGVPVIGLILIFPTFTLTILSVCIPSKTIKFVSELLSMFTSIFFMASGIISMFKVGAEFWWPFIILIVCSLIMLVVTVIQVVKKLTESKE